MEACTDSTAGITLSISGTVDFDHPATIVRHF